MPVRKVVKIDEELCNGCGECVPACAEGAIQMIGGVARLMGDNLCDGLGACLGDCPTGAITIEERDAEDFDEGAVVQHLSQLGSEAKASPKDQVTPNPISQGFSPGPGGGCPGAKVLQFENNQGNEKISNEAETGSQPSELRQWPIQLHLVPPTAPYFKDADMLLGADCVAYAIGDFHRKYLKGHGLAIACPKLDQGMEIYLEKLVAMIDQAGINTLTVMIMEVPCCAGLLHLAKEATARAGRKVPVKEVVVNLRGEIISENWFNM